YKFIMDLVDAREQCVVAFNYTHEREHLTKWARSYGFSYGVIDGSTSVTRRNEYVDMFQAGDLRIIFAHPQSAGHGLTLTRGTSTAWASPTYNAEPLQQRIKRINPAAQ